MLTLYKSKAIIIKISKQKQKMAHLLVVARNCAV